MWGLGKLIVDLGFPDFLLFQVCSLVRRGPPRRCCQGGRSLPPLVYEFSSCMGVGQLFGAPPPSPPQVSVRITLPSRPQEVNTPLMEEWLKAPWSPYYICLPPPPDHGYFTITLARRDTVCLTSDPPIEHIDFHTSPQGGCAAWEGGVPHMVGALRAIRGWAWQVRAAGEC